MKKNDYSYLIAQKAVRALAAELETTPKPGLVDRKNSGAHKDMDYETFRRSIEALKPCYRQCTEAGWDYKEFPVSQGLRRAGLAGERAMYKATGGVNTHKGLIFSLGLICGACGLLARQRLEETCQLEAGGKTTGNAMDKTTGNTTGESQKEWRTWPSFEADELQDCIKSLARQVLEINQTPAKTHGNLVYAKTGIYGAKGEALSGFATAFEVGLPVLRESLEAGQEQARVNNQNQKNQNNQNQNRQIQNSAMVKALISLMAVVDDTNLVYRGGLEALKLIKEQAKDIARKGFDMEAVCQLDRLCIEKNLSPGGSADLLAITAMLHQVVQKRRKP